LSIESKNCYLISNTNRSTSKLLIIISHCMYTETLVAPLTQVHSRYTVYGSQKNTSLHLSLQQLQLTTKLFCCAQKGQQERKSN